MKEENRHEYVTYRLESARKTYEAAQVLADSGYWNSAVNRLYYALFYAVNALLVKHGIEVKSHSSTRVKFSQYFVKTGKFDKKYGKLLSELFDWRQKGDYDNFFDHDEQAVKSLFNPVAEMINLVIEEIEREK